MRLMRGTATAAAATAAAALLLSACGSPDVRAGTAAAPRPATAAAAPTTAAAAPAPTRRPHAVARPGAHARHGSPSAPRRPASRTGAAPSRTFTAGNPAGRAPVPAEAAAVDTSRPTRVVGDGTPAGCTSQAVVDAVAAGGVITFSCGPAPVTIAMKATAKVRNTSSRVVLDGGGRVTLSGGGVRRILYMNTCDQRQQWTTSHCADQAEPRLTVQNLAFADGDATGQRTDGGGGGALFVRGGRLAIVHSRFTGNRCDATGQDLGGAAVRVLDQYRDLPVYVSGSTFTGGRCSNGGALSSIGVSWVVLNSLMSGNAAVGHGANPARPGTSGGGSGGAVYTDGNRYSVRIAGSVLEDNRAAEGGGAVFFVSNDRSGTLRIGGSILRRNTSAGFETPHFPGVFFLGAGAPVVTAAAG
ncbi:hypothetical protein LO771_24380 [Streptacidiphilus sp. ASG 303]|uniref:hypothetical protein n=1 Tax=Streptacidiphilus sp. ASG 303 TaxID=2896847 RepID=UPI001E515079|nr:hypothetical protein [Streptacidiphilus sp. ASG 303]MCD0485436.1 hypothetical protein [Streptacidiphilus sp. ASG 303]